MRYLRLRYENEDDTEYDTIVVFERDYKEEKVEKIMRELWEKQKSINVRDYLDHNGVKVKDMITFNDIDVMYVR